MGLPRDQRHRARFVDMSIDGNLLAAGQVRKLGQKLRRASLRTCRTERQGDARMAMLLRRHDVPQQPWQIDALEWLDGSEERTTLLRRHDLFPEGDRFCAG